jgi:hypothetical protein
MHDEAGVVVPNLAGDRPLQHRRDNEVWSMLLHGIRHHLIAGRQVNRDAVAAVGQLDLQPLAEAVMCCRDEHDAHVASSPLQDSYGKRRRNRTRV